MAAPLYDGIDHGIGQNMGSTFLNFRDHSVIRVCSPSSMNGSSSHTTVSTSIPGYFPFGSTVGTPSNGGFFSTSTGQSPSIGGPDGIAPMQNQNLIIDVSRKHQMSFNLGAATSFNSTDKTTVTAQNSSIGNSTLGAVSSGIAGLNSLFQSPVKQPSPMFGAQNEEGSSCRVTIRYFQICSSSRNLQVRTRHRLFFKIQIGSVSILVISIQVEEFRFSSFYWVRNVNEFCGTIHKVHPLTAEAGCREEFSEEATRTIRKTIILVLKCLSLPRNVGIC